MRPIGTGGCQSYYSGDYPSESKIPRMRAERALRPGNQRAADPGGDGGTRMSVFRQAVGAMAGDSKMDFLHLPPQEGKHEIAAWGLRLLGKEARPAVPALIRC